MTAEAQAKARLGAYGLPDDGFSMARTLFRRQRRA